MLSYDAESGALTWKRAPNRRIRVGATAGTFRKDGRRQLRINSVLYFAARVCWRLANGVDPTGEIDHINGDPLDNRLCNLRDVSRKTNAQNKRRAQKNNRSGVLGVQQMAGGKFLARIGVFGKTKCLGLFDTAALASDAYVQAKRALHQGCTL